MLKQSGLDRTFQALSDPVRRGMLAQLSRGPASVSELAKPFRISLPAVMQHLAALESSGLVHSRKQGRVRTVRLETEALDRAQAWISERRSEWEAHVDRLDDYVSRLKAKGDS